ncbi:DMT family transporter [Citroniella saccharovorans]|uniref:DMT family transporter n=1 Tax=Citroniella saccharovorans TaxID=2053367 RepID=A0AAW9MTY4_9FIRM|nr:DMT family transporter [Citroniella saccharovorans]MEB3429069.1 DMT family transporter [Citroniella saccharovorans]
MNHKIKTGAVILALLAAVFYAINTPVSKFLLNNVTPTFMAAFLYLGAGVGVGIMYLFHIKKEEKAERLTKQDLPYTIGMIVLDIAAPIFLMIGIKMGTASNASLLGNFEIVVTTLMALLIFKEQVSGKLWIAIGFITLSSIVLSFEGSGSFQFSIGSLFVILATCCWGLENNCTRKISDKSTYEIVLLKGIFSGGGSFTIAMVLGEKIPEMIYIAIVMLLGFVAYGLSIFLYIRAQRNLGAAKTSAYYAVAPFIGSFLAFVVNGEKLAVEYFIGLALMLVGTVFVVYDTMINHHLHGHTHTIVHTHNGVTHTHMITHEHEHNHFGNEERHGHKHEDYINSQEHKLAHIHG